MAKNSKKSEGFITETIKYMLANKMNMSLDQRRKKFGISADCNIITENDLVAIVVDNPLPDDDMAVIITSKEKVIDSVLGKIGSKFMQEAKDVEFFED